VKPFNKNGKAMTAKQLFKKKDKEQKNLNASSFFKSVERQNKRLPELRFDVRYTLPTQYDLYFGIKQDYNFINYENGIYKYRFPPQFMNPTHKSIALRSFNITAPKYRIKFNWELRITTQDEGLKTINDTVNILIESSTSLFTALNTICAAVNVVLRSSASDIIKNSELEYVHVHYNESYINQSTVDGIEDEIFNYITLHIRSYSEDDIVTAIRFTIYPLIDHIIITKPETYLNPYSNLRRLFNEKIPETPNEMLNYMSSILLDELMHDADSDGYNYYTNDYIINDFWDRSTLNLHANFSNNVYNYVSSSTDPQYNYGKVFVINNSGGTFDIWFSNDGVNKLIVNDVAAQFELTYVLNAKPKSEYNMY
jgi:hypothetical protein